MKIGHAVLVLALFVCMEPAFALRCGNRLVSEGDHQLKIEKYCGEPAAVTLHTVYRSGIPTSRHRHGRQQLSHANSSDELLIHNRSLEEVQIEEWTYNFGPRRLMRVIRFENGLVTNVTALGYGYIQ
jgi:hypothetical protein